ncbi:multiple sugar transport system permease protein [Murinocardiopsis flavida]|uniref:Multiple sugar transport system permease protein n=1 Tax=Murinocardiopsis flavida TaxID=645275 RepID=A0A2P8CYZ1_9ACTN|nr:carbohydrate ABC transporter permease [Murinocardiopsis flavida]PSK90191.1 multiple sugar transport system permease protein [Murinocardiopsis flavida]
MAADVRPAAAPQESPANGTGRRALGARRRPSTSRIIIVAALTLAALYFLIPAYWLAVAATKSLGGLYGSFGLWFSEPQLWANLTALFTHDGGVFLRWSANTLLYAGVGSVVATLLAASTGYVLAKFEFRGRDTVFNVVLAGVLLPGTALALPSFMLFTELGLSNTVWAILLPSMVSPFGVYLCRIYAAAAVPDALIEAARVDGAGEIRIFATIALRIMTPALVTVLLFQFVSIWNNFFLPLVMLSDDRLYPITLGLVTLNSISERVPETVGLVVTGSFVAVVPLAVMMIVLQRFWRTGLTEGGVKS